jgi:hypothetical protein
MQSGVSNNAGVVKYFFGRTNPCTPGEMNLSVVGGVVHQISVILNGTMYTVLYDPPLKGDDKFSSLRRYVRVAARIDGGDLTIQWPDKTKARGRIIRREKIEPERPRPA